MTRFLGVAVAGVLLLSGCALVDDARREWGSDPDRQAASPAPPSVPSSYVPPSSPPGQEGATPPPEESSRGVEPNPACPPSGVLVRTGLVDAAMGLRAMGIELVNCGSVPYSVNGYPAVRVLNGSRAPLPVTVVQGSEGVAAIDSFNVPPAPVTAAPGERLVAGLVWRNTVTDTTVDPVNGAYLEIGPAPGVPPQIVRPEGPVDVGTTGRLGVSAWRRPQR